MAIKLPTQTNNSVESKIPPGIVDVKGLLNIVFTGAVKKPHSETIMRLARCKAIPSVKVGRRTFFNPPDVMAKLTKGTK